MAAHGKTIQLFLMDGEATGRIKCTLANWTVIAYKIPRIMLEQCKDRKDLKQSGVYFLFGASEKEDREKAVYVGQAIVRQTGEGLLNRISEHIGKEEEDYWNEAVAFTTSNDILGATEISYLEHRFCEPANKAKRYEVKNKDTPNIGNPTEEKENEMEEFIDYAKIVMGALGYKLFEPYDKQENEQEDPEPKPDEEPLLYLDRKITDVGSVHATGRQTNEGFIVYKGSHISLVNDDTVLESIKRRKEKVSLDENGNITEDQFSTSPSAAAMFVVGKNANGLTSWRNKDKVTLRDLEEKASEEATE